jgi:lipoprotein-anchoring transpeptidase ErfK/SrfK
MRFKGLGSAALLLAVGAGLIAGKADARGHPHRHAADLDKEMTAEEIYEEFVADPQIAPVSRVSDTQVQETGADQSPYALALEGDDLPVTPEARMTSMIPAHLYPYFDLYLYVNKAESGLWAQQMFIYEKAAAGSVLAVSTRQEPAPRFDLKHRWLVSTGRNNKEKPWTITPPGLFQLDPKRLFPRAYSSQFDVPMPFAMFFDYAYRHRKSGYAIHGVIPKYENLLGQRASAGCIRLHIPLAEKLFRSIKPGLRGDTPIFPFDKKVGLTFRDGRVKRDAQGNVILRKGYRVLLIIDDNPGEEPATAEGGAQEN